MRPTSAHHGCCVGGDEQFHGIAKALGIPLIGHPPKNRSHMAHLSGYSELLPAKDYIPRNHDIVDAVALLIAAPHTEHEVLRSGTWATFRYARKIECPIYLILPSGKIQWFRGSQAVLN
jgi:hypothetical protein